MTTMLQRGTRTPVVVVLLSLAPVASRAWDLSWQPRVTVESRAADNLRSQDSGQEAAWGLDTGAGLVLTAESPTWSSTLMPAFNIRRFVIGEDADAEEYEVLSRHAWDVTGRANAGLEVDYIRNSTLTTELEDAGRVNTVTNRDTVSVRPTIAHALTDRTSINSGFYFTDVNYQEVPGAGFSDYDYKQVTGGVSHALSPTLGLFTNAYVSEFETPATGGKSLTYGGQGGVSYAQSRTLQGEFGVGYSQSEIDFVTEEVTGFRFAIDPGTGQIVLVPLVTRTENTVLQSGPIASATIRKQFAEADARLAYSRAISPSAFGAQTISDDIELTVDHPLTEHLELGFRGTYNMRAVESDEITSARGNLNRNQTVLSTSLSYRVTEEVFVTGTYRFLWNEQSDPDRNVYNNSLFVTLTYRGVRDFYRGL